MNRPVWVVDLVYKAPGHIKEKRDQKFVRSSTEQGAIDTEKFHSMLPLKASAYARIATPKDLGCVPV